MAGIVELRLERGERLARAPVAVGDDRDGLFSRTTRFTPGMASAGPLSTDTSLPPKTGAISTAAYSMPGNVKSMP